MGYSLSVPCKSTKAAEHLAAFLREHLRPFSVVCDESPDIRAEFAADALVDDRRRFPLPTCGPNTYDPTTFVCLGHELAYGSGSTKVGFNLSTTGQYGIYMHAVLAWAATRVGRRRGLNNLAIVGHADQRVAYTTWDNQPQPVLTATDIAAWDPKEREYGEIHWLVDKFGLRTFGDTTHYAHQRGWRDEGEGARKALLHSMWARDKALRAITEREMERLNRLWEAR